MVRRKLECVQVRYDHTPDLPKVPGHAAETQPVRTNLIDNATDAMNGKGTLAHRADEHYVVEIADGPGIPHDTEATLLNHSSPPNPPAKPDRPRTAEPHASNQRHRTRRASLRNRLRRMLSNRRMVAPPTALHSLRPHRML
jgi:hypothetical protein